MALRAGLGAGDHEAPVGLVGQRGPHLLPVDDPVVVLEPGLGRDGRQVRPGAGLGVALAPELLHRHDPRQEALLLLRGPEGDQRRAEQLLAEMVHARRSVGPRVLLVEDHLLEQRQAAAAVLLGPADAGPAVLREVAVPLDPLVVGLVLPARTALPAQLGEVAAEVLLQPGTDLGAERLVLLAVGQVHADTVAYQALVWFRQARPQSRQECPMSVPPQQRPGTLPGVLRAAAERYGDKAAYVEGDRTLSFTELLEQVRAVARGYVALGLEPGARVVVWAPNSIDWVVAGLAVSYAGGTLVPANSRYTGHEVADIVDRTGASLVLVADGFLDRTQIADLQAASDLASVLEVVDLASLDWVSQLGDDSLAEEVEARADAVSPDDVADILFTSGTTGRPKGAMSAHRQTIGVADAWSSLGGVSAEDRYLVVNPFFHSFGYKIGIVVGLLTGATLYPVASFDLDADDAADPGRPDHGAARRAHDLPVAAHRAEPLRLRPVLVAPRRHRRRGGARGPDRADARARPGGPRDRQRGDGLRDDRGRGGDHVPRRRLGRARRQHLRSRDPRHGGADRRAGRAAAARRVRDARLPRRPGGDPGGHRRGRLAAHRRRRDPGRGGQPDDHRPAQGHVHLRWLQRLPGRGGAGADAARGGQRRGRGRRTRRADG